MKDLAKKSTFILISLFAFICSKNLLAYSYDFKVPYIPLDGSKYMLMTLDDAVNQILNSKEYPRSSLKVEFINPRNYSTYKTFAEKSAQRNATFATNISNKWFSMLRPSNLLLSLDDPAKLTSEVINLMEPNSASTNHKDSVVNNNNSDKEQDNTTKSKKTKKNIINVLEQLEDHSLNHLNWD